MIVEIILMPLIYTAKNNQNCKLPNNHFVLKDFNISFLKEMIFEPNNKELEKNKEQSNHAKFNNFTGFSNSKNISFFNTDKKNKSLNQAIQIDLTKQISFYNKFYKKNKEDYSKIKVPDKKLNTLLKKREVIDKEINSIIKQNDDLNTSCLKFQNNKDIQKFKNTAHLCQKKLDMKNRCVDISLCQLNLLKESTFDQFKFTCMSNELFLLILHIINLSKQIRFMKQQRLKTSEKSIILQNAPFLKIQQNFTQPLSFDNQNAKKFISYTLNTINDASINPNLNCKKHKDLPYRSQNSFFITPFYKNLFFQCDNKSAFESNINSIHKYMQVTKQINTPKKSYFHNSKNICTSQYETKAKAHHKINHQQKQKISAFCLSEQPNTILNIYPKCDTTKLFQQKLNKSHETIFNTIKNTTKISQKERTCLKNFSQKIPKNPNINISEQHIINNKNTKLNFKSLSSTCPSMPSYFYCGSLSMTETEDMIAPILIHQKILLLKVLKLQ